GCHMPWCRGCYFRSRRVGGKVVSEYVGSGPLARAAAAVDEAARQERRGRRAAGQRRMAPADEIEHWAEQGSDEADGMRGAAMRAAGYHRPGRGRWRKNRER